MANVKKGDRVKIWHECDREGASVLGQVERVLPDGWIRASLDPEHELATHRPGGDVEQPRILTVAPDLYEVIP
jgi:hypothetical protein